ncbi:hypothetical protein FACS189451_06470 [Bacteroidia bacterium]|nr:hypothetical protein FACS189451_06470 [Bacteroidia bacterium]
MTSKKQKFALAMTGKKQKNEKDEQSKNFYNVSVAGRHNLNRTGARQFPELL